MNYGWQCFIPMYRVTPECVTCAGTAVLYSVWLDMIAAPKFAKVETPMQQIAQLNVARMKYEFDDPRMQGKRKTR